MFYLKIQYIFEDIYHDLLDYFQKRFSPSPPKYRISFVERDKENHKMINERIIEDGIADIKSLSQKYICILKAFNKNSSSGIPKKPDSSFYVEISEVRKKLKKIAFANVLSTT